MTGYWKSRFVDLTDSNFEELKCGICSGVFRDPIETSCCRKTFCTHCITEWIANNNNTCPNDGKTLTQNDLIESSEVVLNLLGKLKIKCEFSDNGCPEEVLLHALRKHTEECDYNKCKNCGESMASIMSSGEHNCEHSLKLRVKHLLSDNKFLVENNQQLISKNTKLETVLRKHKIIFCSKCDKEGHSETQCKDNIAGNTAQAIDRGASTSNGDPYQRDNFSKMQINNDNTTTRGTAETIGCEIIVPTGEPQMKNQVSETHNIDDARSSALTKYREASGQTTNNSSSAESINQESIEPRVAPNQNIQHRESQISNNARSSALTLYQEDSCQIADPYKQNHIIGETQATPSPKNLKLESGLQKHNTVFCYKCGEVGHSETQCIDDNADSSAHAIDREASATSSDSCERNHFRKTQITENTTRSSAQTSDRASIAATGEPHEKFQIRETQISNNAQSSAQTKYHEDSGQRADSYKNEIIGKTQNSPTSFMNSNDSELNYRKYFGESHQEIQSMEAQNIFDKAVSSAQTQNHEVSGQRANTYQHNHIRETQLIDDKARSSAQTKYHEDRGKRDDTYQQNYIISETQSTPPPISEFDSYTVLWHDLNRTPKCSLPLPPLKPDNEKLLFIKVPLGKNCVPKPYPSHYNDTWDSRHYVSMPCSAQNKVPRGHSNVSKWKIIHNTFLQTKLKTASDLVNAITTYNPMMRTVNFNCLLRVLDEYSHDKRIFNEFFPQLIELTLRLPEIVTKPINLLRHNTNATIFLRQYQIACLLANAFFCTYPKRSEASVEYKDYPSINFISLFTSDNQYDLPKVQKLKCIINYFRRVMQNMPTCVVSFERRCLASDEVPKWSQSSKALRKLNVCTDGLIERDGSGLLQVDFANKLVGGGVLSSGCVQEEIRFTICPELIVSRLFTEKLNDNEVLIVNGCEQFNDYSGYGNRFEWKQDFVDNTPTDDWVRRHTTVVVMDALHFTNHQKTAQYCIKLVERELNKAYCGFFDRNNYLQSSNKCAIASGNWGCGAFNGDPQLKAIIQLMAASQSDRDLLLSTFTDVGIKTTLQRFYEFVVRNEFTVSHLYRALEYYDKYMTNSKITHKLGVIDYIMKFKDNNFNTNLLTQLYNKIL